MKICHYKKQSTIFFISALLILIEIILGIILFQRKEYTHQKLFGVLLEKNKVLLVINQEEQKLLYQNHYLVLQDKQLAYEIIEMNPSFQKKQEQYYEATLKIKTPKEKKINDSMEFSLKGRKEPVMKLLKNVWGGD